MRYVEYGKTGKQVSVVGFGGLRFDLEKSDEENAKLVKYAYEKGINYFDTAPGYCDDRSEAIFGVAFREMMKEGKNVFYVFTNFTNIFGKSMFCFITYFVTIAG